MQQRLDLYTIKKFIGFPSFKISFRLYQNKIVQLIQQEEQREVLIEEYKKGRVYGYIANYLEENKEILIVTNNGTVTENFNFVLRAQSFNLKEEGQINIKDGHWIKYETSDYKHIIENSIYDRPKLIATSWYKSFVFNKEDKSQGEVGLRNPQIGAVHAVHSHLTISRTPIIVVMPTGTGKTETMLSLLISCCPERLLVIVPTDALRTQISNKFITLGLLKKLKVIPNAVYYPIVGILSHRPKSENEVDDFFKRCNVIVSTMNVLGQCESKIQEKISSLCPFLFIDEAHHTAARTWNLFKKKFLSSFIVQFTATPFREDGKSIEGKIIYNYSLRKAQEEGYFKTINFKPISEYLPQKKDLSIAKQAISQLRHDTEKGLNHILMARVATTERAEEVFKIYQKYPEFNPVKIHSKMKKGEVIKFKNNIINGNSKIIVCVDMLGEGFDLPELKIAAFHDIRKSLPITLQLAGRFVRARYDLGDPTFITNIADIEVKDELRQLYTRDPDWNYLLPEASMAAIANEIELREFIEGFIDPPKDFSFQNLRPALSTVIYKTKCEHWYPEKYKEGFLNEDYNFIKHSINYQKNTLVIITGKRVKNEWAKNEALYTWLWELNIIFWSEYYNLLFIHGSNNRGFYQDLAQVLAGDDVEHIRGLNVFRCFSNINRLKLQNVGLLENLGRLIRFTMRAGSDIEPALTEAQRRNTYKTNIFGAGYEDGKRVTMGCSYKGRIWARKTANLSEFFQWCLKVGKKLLDESIDPEEVLKGTLVAVEISSRPNIMPVNVEWPDFIYKHSEINISFILPSNEEIPFYLVDLELRNPKGDGNIIFALNAYEFYLELELEINLKSFNIFQRSENNILISIGASKYSIVEFFEENPPIVWFVNGASLRGNDYIELKRVALPYSPDKIVVWDWENTDITKESQGINKDDDSIQFKVINEIQADSYDIIYDDDDPGEIADVIGIKINEDKIIIDLYHCKFSLSKEAGARIKDLYEVCGQAQKCIHWADKDPQEFFMHLLRRNTKHRLEKGSEEEIFLAKEKSRITPIEYGVYIVQPGLSKEKVSLNQLELLSVTENYLMETFLIPLTIIANK